MKNISGYSNEDKVEVLMDRFEDIFTEVRRVYFVTNLEYALQLQFVDRLEKIRNINSNEKLRLKNLIENEDRKLRAHDVTEKSMKELNNIKVVDNREEVYCARSKKYSAQYVK